MINQILGYHFNNPLLLNEALTHPSLRSGHKSLSYERLEFLGDSVLSFIISELLMNNFPTEEEGKLAKRRAYLVSGEMITKIATQVNLGDKIIMTEAESKSGGRENDHNLENVLEAIIAAIYFDGGFPSIKPIIYDLWQPFIEQMVEVPIDSKSKLQEILQSKAKGLPQYKLIESSGPEHMLTFKISLLVDGYEEVVATGKSKQQAEKNAATLLLEKMNE
ncbi:MAG: ribonuclease III [Rickettsiales bacterium]